MNIYLSNKIKIISFLSIILVVFLHSYNFDTKQNGSVLVFEKSVFWCIENYISNGLTRIAVPFFFIFSGFLFFLNYGNTLIEFKVKLKKRIETLFIPFLFWSLFGILIYFLLQNFPGIKTFFTKELIVDFSFIKWIKTIFIEPIPYQLWFIRDLMILVLVSPLLYVVLKYFKIVIVFLLLLLWMYDSSSLKNSTEALLFFTFGAYLALTKIELSTNFSKLSTLFLFVFWLAILSLFILVKYFDYNFVIQTLIFKVSIIVGLLGTWSMYDLLYEKNEKSINRILLFTTSTFFIYASHEPVLTIIKKILFIVLGKEELNYIEIYFIAPITTIILCYYAGKILKSTYSKFYGLITGSR